MRRRTSRGLAGPDRPRRVSRTDASRAGDKAETRCHAHACEAGVRCGWACAQTQRHSARQTLPANPRRSTVSSRSPQTRANNATLGEPCVATEPAIAELSPRLRSDRASLQADRTPLIRSRRSPGGWSPRHPSRCPISGDRNRKSPRRGEGSRGLGFPRGSHPAPSRTPSTPSHRRRGPHITSSATCAGTTSWTSTRHPVTGASERYLRPVSSAPSIDSTQREAPARNVATM